MNIPITLAGKHEGAKIRLDLEQHYNDGLEVVYLRKGHARWAVEDQILPVQPGDLFFTLPWERHGGVERFQWGLHLEWFILNVGERPGRLQMPPGVPYSETRWSMLEDLLLRTPVRCLPVPESFGNLLAEIAGEYEAQTEQASLRLPHLISLFLLDLETLLQGDAPQNPPRIPEADKRVRQWIEAVSRHPESTAPLDEMAESCGLKRSRFSALVKSATGDTPINFLNRLRIQKACNLLEHTEESITHIAFECGYESSQYFARMFRSYMNCSPGDYRNGDRGMEMSP